MNRKISLEICLAVIGAVAFAVAFTVAQLFLSDECNWAAATDPAENSPIWVNMQNATVIYGGGTFRDREGKTYQVGATIWYGQKSTAVKETPEVLISRCRMRK